MKKNRLRLTVLSFFVVFLLLVVFFINKPGNFIISDKIIKPFAQVKLNAVKEIVIDKAGLIISMHKKNNKWYLNKDGIEFPADLEKINKILNDFSSITCQETVSKNKARHSNFGIGDNKIILKTLTNNYIVYIGQVIGTNKTYIRINEENNVYATSGFFDIFASSNFDYRDLNVYFLKDENKVQSFEINYDDNLTSFKKSKGKWITPDNIQGKDDRIDFFLNDLKNLRAADILTIKPELPNYPELSIKINKETARFYSIYDDANNYYLQTSDSGVFFKIPAVFVSSLKKVEGDFIE